MNKTESYDYPLWEQNLEREIQGFYDQDVISVASLTAES